MMPPTGLSHPRFSAPYAEDVTPPLLRDCWPQAGLMARRRSASGQGARPSSAQSARAGGALGGVEEMLREYALSTREGLALMALAEALLRVPDAATADRLIEDKLGQGDFVHHEGEI